MKRGMVYIIALMAVLGCATTAWATDAQQARDLAAGCANCHGTNGRVSGASLVVHSLAGVRPEEQLKQLNDFKTGLTPSTVMQDIVNAYSEAQLAAIAGWFAAQAK